MRVKVWLEVWPGPTHEKCEPCDTWPWRSVERARRAVERGDVVGDFIVCCNAYGYDRGYSFHVVREMERGRLFWLSSREIEHYGWSVAL
jgi:hypothetical protein